MSVYAIFTYNVTDPDRYAQYVPASAAAIFGTITKHGGEVLFADYEAAFEAGEARGVAVGIKLPDADAFHAWETDPDYAEAKGHRLASTSDYTVFVAQGFVPPSA